jgi:hypothetical protein
MKTQKILTHEKMNGFIPAANLVSVVEQACRILCTSLRSISSKLNNIML